MHDLQICDTPLQTVFGSFRLVAYEFAPESTHVALVAGKLHTMDHPFVRVQSSCVTSTVFGGNTCDCAEQLQLSLQFIASAGSGCVLYLAQEGLGHGLLEKVAQLQEQSMGYDIVEAVRRRGVPLDRRQYSDAAWILNHLIGHRSIRLLSNNPEKIQGLERAGVSVYERVPCEAEPTEQNLRYLLVKKEKMGHLLTRV